MSMTFKWTRQLQEFDFDFDHSNFIVHFGLFQKTLPLWLFYFCSVWCWCTKHRFRFMITIALYFYDGQSWPYPNFSWARKCPPSPTMKILTITPRQRNFEELMSKRTSSKKTSPFCFLFCNHGYNAIVVQLSKSQCINFVCGKELERQLSPLHLNWTNYFNNRQLVISQEHPVLTTTLHAIVTTQFLILHYEHPTNWKNLKRTTIFSFGIELKYQVATNDDSASATPITCRHSFTNFSIISKLIIFRKFPFCIQKPIHC